jgi:hypothetical protein
MYEKNRDDILLLFVQHVKKNILQISIRNRIIARFIY